MNFWLHKINPSQDEQTQPILLDLLKRLNLLGMGFSNLAEELSIEEILSHDEAGLRETMKKIYPDRNFNITTVNNVRFFTHCMQKDDIVIIPLTKQYDNKVYIAKIVNSMLINAQKESCLNLSEYDVGFLRSVGYVKEFDFDELPINIKELIERNRGLNTTVKIDNLLEIKNICDLYSFVCDIDRRNPNLK